MLAQRKALIEWLSSLEAPQIKRVDETARAADGCGTVTSNIEEGYVTLVPEGRPMAEGTRLVFTKEAKKLPVSAGNYRVRRYVVDKGDWEIWATGNGRAVEVTAGAETKLTLDLDVKLKYGPMVKGAKVTLCGSFNGDSGMGLSLVHGDARIVVGWKVTQSGKELGSGECAYG